MQSHTDMLPETGQTIHDVLLGNHIYFLTLVPRNNGQTSGLFIRLFMFYLDAWEQVYIPQGVVTARTDSDSNTRQPPVHPAIFQLQNLPSEKSVIY